MADDSAQIIEDLLRVIRGQFCGDLSAKEWGQSQRFFKRVLTWPAAWLKARGVTLPPARYKAILLEVFNTIKRHGKTGAVTYWPGYLLHCIQEHFKHQGEAYYDEAKCLRNLAEKNLLVLGKLRAGKAPDPVMELAAAHRILKAGSKRPRATRKSSSQLPLL